MKKLSLFLSVFFSFCLFSEQYKDFLYSEKDIKYYLESNNFYGLSSVHKENTDALKKFVKDYFDKSLEENLIEKQSKIQRKIYFKYFKNILIYAGGTTLAIVSTIYFFKSKKDLESAKLDKQEAKTGLQKLDDDGLLPNDPNLLAAQGNYHQKANKKIKASLNANLWRQPFLYNMPIPLGIMFFLMKYYHFDDELKLLKLQLDNSQKILKLLKDIKS